MQRRHSGIRNAAGGIVLIKLAKCDRPDAFLACFKMEAIGFGISRNQFSNIFFINGYQDRVSFAKRQIRIYIGGKFSVPPQCYDV